MTSPEPDPGGPRSVAFFDMDRTLIAANSGRVYARALRREGRLTVGQSLKVASWLARYTLAGGDMTPMLARVIGDLRGLPEQEVIDRCEVLFAREIEPTIYAEALERLRAHRARGERVVLLSASTPYFVRILAQRVDADDYLCTRPLVRAGLFTGEYDPPICFGAGKVVWAERYCAAHGARLDDCTFYTDSASDLPVLERVGKPVVVNPDPRLRRHARRRGWPVHAYRTTLAAPGG